MIRAGLTMHNADIDLHDLDADILFYHRVHDLPEPYQAGAEVDPALAVWNEPERNVRPVR